VRVFNLPAGANKVQKIKTFLWFDGNAEEAAIYYVAAFKNSKITQVNRQNGKAFVVEFTLDGIEYVALNGGPMFKLSEAMSLMVNTENQAETDQLWDYLVAGGSPSMCGWLKDQFGLSWQIVPARFMEMMRVGTPEQQTRVMGAMMQMRKFEEAALELAFKG
jgi:predicted 3-demethylubiquinone-9 3-methyltransferase (glyoxalase superfamily)